MSGSKRKAKSSKPVSIIPEVYKTADDLSNAVIIVEEEKLHVNKELLMIASPVFKAMFGGLFMEASTSEVNLKDKKLQHVIWMLDYIYPNRKHKVTDETAAKLLPLAIDYQLDGLMSKCVSVLKRQEYPRLEIVTLAQRYQLHSLLSDAIEASASQIYSGSAGYFPDQKSMSSQLKLQENAELSEENLIDIYEEKLGLCFSRNNELEKILKEIHCKSRTSDLSDSDSSDRDTPEYQPLDRTREKLKDITTKSTIYTETDIF